MVKVEGMIQNKSGFHVRPAQLFVEKANEFTSAITVKNAEGMETDGRSILGLMTLGFEFDTKMMIETQGEDEAAAAQALLELLNSKFGEE